MEFDKSWSTDKLISWLKARGLGSTDRQILKDEELDGQSFLLLDKDVLWEMGVRLGGQVLLEHLLKEVDNGEINELDGTVCVDEDYEPDHMLDIIPCGEIPHDDILKSPSEQKICEQLQGSGAAACTDHLWFGREILHVYFMNPNHLETDSAKWHYNEQSITPEMIIDWANIWNPEAKNSQIPYFKRTHDETEAEIRVLFASKNLLPSDENQSWSMVGKKAECVRNDKPTMVLNLSSPFYYKRQKIVRRDSHKKSVVIHEFGHALGLGHEHQRSDFWQHVGKYLDREIINNELQHSDSTDGKATYDSNWKEDPKLRRCSRDYDPSSIMHYEFQRDWLKKNLREKIIRSKHVDEHPDLIHTEDRKYMKKFLGKLTLAEAPSKTDLEFLKEVYNPTLSS